MLIKDVDLNPPLRATPPQLPAMLPAQAENTVSYQRSRDGQIALLHRGTKRLMVGASLSLLAVVCVYSVVFANDGYRFWETSDGRRSKVRLAVVEQTDSAVRFKREDNGGQFEIPFTKLSREDRAYLDQQNLPSDPPVPAATDTVAEEGAVAEQPRIAGRQASGNWPVWRGPSRDGVVPAGPPLARSWPADGPKKLWESERIRGEWEGGWGSVSIAQGRAYVYVNVPGNKQQPQSHSSLDIVYCLDANSGDTIWKYEQDGGTHTTPSNGTPCIVDGRCFASGSGGFVYCLDAQTGREIWTAQTGRMGPETSSSFVVADGVAVILSGPLSGLDVETGQEVWQQSRLKARHSSPTVWKRGDRAFVICNTERGELVCVDIKTGDIEWQFRSHGGHSTPIVSGDYLVLAGGGALGAYRLGDSEPEELWNVGMGCRGATPVVYDGHVYAVASGQAACIRISDGEEVWREGVGNTEYSSPIVADGKVFAVVKRTLQMFKTGTDRLEQLDTADLRIVPCTSPTIADGKLYLRHHQHIACYDLRS
jgi:outer membrane protein assembly factor BamB